MSEIEQGIELTLKVLMKVKDDEIMAMYDEIKHRDTEIEKLKQENEALKAQNESLKMQQLVIKNAELKSENTSLKTKIKAVKTREKLVIKKLKFSTIQKLKKIKKKGAEMFSQMQKDHKSEIEELEEEIEEIKEKNDEEVQELKNQLEMEIKRVKSYQSALGALVDQNKSEKEKLLTKSKNQNIAIFKDILHRYGCVAAWRTASNFPDFSDGRDGTENVVTKNGASMNVYDFQFEKCSGCKNNGQCMKKNSSVMTIQYPLGYRPPLRSTVHKTFKSAN